MTSRRGTTAGLSVPLAVCGAMLSIAFIAGLGVSHLNAAQPRLRSAIVSVLDRNDAPVSDLTVNAITVHEDGRAREVVRVSPAPPPGAIALLIDDSQAAMPVVRDLRQALTMFADEITDLQPAPPVRLTTVGDRPTVLVDFIPTFSAVSRGIDRVMPRSGSGSTLLEAIVETSRDLRARELAQPVIIAFVVEAGPELSATTRAHVEDALERANASLWVIALAAPPGVTAPDINRERAEVLGDVTERSGGRTRFVLTSQELPKAFAEIGQLLLSRYEITYGRPETLIPPSRIEIRARDAVLKVLTPRWAAP